MASPTHKADSNLWAVGSPDRHQAADKREVFEKMMKEVSSFEEDDHDMRLPRVSAANSHHKSAPSKALGGGGFDSDDDDDDDDGGILDFINASKDPAATSSPRKPCRVDELPTTTGDWKGHSGQPRDGFKKDGLKSSLSEERRQSAARAEDLRAYVTKAVGQEGRVTNCYVERERGPVNYLNPTFRLYTDKPPDEGSSPAKARTSPGKNRKRAGAEFLLSARKISEKKKSYYVISLAETATDVRDSMLVGKLRANWAGSEYHIFDHGLNPGKTEVPSMRRREFGHISFAYSDLGPGKLQVVLPSVAPSGAAQVWRPGPGDTTLAEAVASGGAADAVTTTKLLWLQNKAPAWNNDLRGYALDFGGRVTMPSVKNFQLAAKDQAETVLLQFGKVDKHGFVLDFRAFAIALASMDAKLADHKGYDLFRQVMERRDSNNEGGEGGAKSRPGSASRSSSSSSNGGGGSGRKLTATTDGGWDGVDGAGGSGGGGSSSTASPRLSSMLSGFRFSTTG